jgi:hypothetical protein
MPFIAPHSNRYYYLQVQCQRTATQGLLAICCGAIKIPRPYRRKTVVEGLFYHGQLYGPGEIDTALSQIPRCKRPSLTLAMHSKHVPPSFMINIWMSKYLRVGPGAFDCFPRSYYSGMWFHAHLVFLTIDLISVLRCKISSHYAVPVKPSTTSSNRDLVLNLQRLQYHLKPQPCYTKPYSDSQHSVSSLSIIFAEVQY